MKIQANGSVIKTASSARQEAAFLRDASEVSLASAK
jgi:hypothetical protein